MKYICASSVSLAKEAFSSLGDVQIIDESGFTPDRIRGADAIITRSKTPLTPALLAGSGVRFAGTCTAGTDHADPEGLATLGIEFASAPGCNANAVSEYVVAALLELRHRKHLCLEELTLGIIGHGQVGTRVEQKALALGFKVLKNDPPKEMAGSSDTFVDLETLLAASDIVTVHVPRVDGGPHPTRNLLNRTQLERIRKGGILINASRGEAINSAALTAMAADGHFDGLVLDVWDPEPAFPPRLRDLADLATPHIAGHSVEGKVNGTRMIREAVCRSLCPDASSWDPTPLLPEPKHTHLTLDSSLHPMDRLYQAVSSCYDIQADDTRFRLATPPLEKAFTSQRRSYPVRREFSATCLHNVPEDEMDRFRLLGFRIAG